MKILRVLILSVIILAGLLFICTYSYIHLKAKNQIISYLKESTKENVTIGYINYAFPFGLTLKEIYFPSYGTIREWHIFLTPFHITAERIPFHFRGALSLYGLEVTARGEGNFEKTNKAIEADLKIEQKNTANQLTCHTDLRNNELAIDGQIQITGELNPAIVQTAFVESLLQGSIDAKNAVVHSRFSYHAAVDALKQGSLKFSGRLDAAESPSASSVQ